MSTVDDIIAKNQIKKRLWMLKNEEEDDEVVSVPTDVPEEFCCPICYEQMKIHNKKPMILYPCGHTICEECLKQYEETSHNQKCCMCNQKYTQSSVNYALLNVLEREINTAPKKTDYTKKLELTKTKLDLMLSQFKMKQSSLNNISSQLKSEKIVMATLDDELAFVQQAHQKQKELVDSLEVSATTIKNEVNHLKDIIDPLIHEVEKLKLLCEAQKMEA